MEVTLAFSAGVFWFQKVLIQKKAPAQTNWKAYCYNCATDDSRLPRFLTAQCSLDDSATQLSLLTILKNKKNVRLC